MQETIQCVQYVADQRKQRNRNGQFARGNSISKRGGRARAHALTPTRRRQIARQGWRGLVAKRFDGDERAAKLWVGAIGAYHYDQRLAGLGWYLRPVFPHPGQPTEFRARLYQAGLFDPMLREPDFYGKVSA
ncbi:MAG: hypothetical protein KDE31_00225 [Caldilineaceae bacterium]|nr:hypothetical protein [Caldilineaceae bacterium]